MHFSRLMIRLNADSMSFAWQPITHPEASSIVRHFLGGERELLRLAGGMGPAARDLAEFLDAVGDDPLIIEQAEGGELLVQPRGDGPTLLVSGKTAAVLGAYLHDEPVRMEDRFNMTQRLRRPAL